MHNNTMRLMFAVPIVTLMVACSSTAPASPPPPTAKPAAAAPAAAAAPTVAPTPAAAAAAAAKPAAAAPAASVNPAATMVVTTPLNAGAYNPATALIIYGDVVLFGATSDNPEACNLKSRFRPGEAVGFRATAIDPLTGSFDPTAQLSVKFVGGDTLPMNYRDTGASPRPGFWTAKWVVPDGAPLGVVHYTIEAKDAQGHTAVWKPFDIASSSLTIAP